MTDSFDRIADRLAIQDLMARYAQGVDRRDWEKVRSTFHPDAYDDHGDYRGGVDGFIEWVRQRHAQIPQSMHFLGNCSIEFTGPDTALAETYYIARQTYGGDAERARAMLGAGARPGPMEAEIWGRYIDIVERRNGSWRTVRRTVAFEVLQAQPSTSLPLGAAWAQAKRDADDPLYAMRKMAVERGGSTGT
ncbi:MAG: nuclear transport factor 2 family protein [Hyphomicrobiaceae bacterium]|nr:nuclear transport factor 2 family protein [Hyphomicrobiaceae bacterium]